VLKKEIKKNNSHHDTQNKDERLIINNNKKECGKLFLSSLIELLEKLLQLLAGVVINMNMERVFALTIAV